MRPWSRRGTTIWLGCTRIRGRLWLPWSRSASKCISNAFTKSSTTWLPPHPPTMRTLSASSATPNRHVILHRMGSVNLRSGWLILDGKHSQIVLPVNKIDNIFFSFYFRSKACKKELWGQITAALQSTKWCSCCLGLIEFLEQFEFPEHPSHYDHAHSSQIFVNIMLPPVNFKEFFKSFEAFNFCAQLPETIAPVEGSTVFSEPNNCQTEAPFAVSPHCNVWGVHGSKIF